MRVSMCMSTYQKTEKPNSTQINPPHEARHRQQEDHSQKEVATHNKDLPQVPTNQEYDHGRTNKDTTSQHTALNTDVQVTAHTKNARVLHANTHGQNNTWTGRNLKMYGSPWIRAVNTPTVTPDKLGKNSVTTRSVLTQTLSVTRRGFAYVIHIQLRRCIYAKRSSWWKDPDYHCADGNHCTKMKRKRCRIPLCSVIIWFKLYHA